MKEEIQPPRNTDKKKPEQLENDQVKSGREGGDDSLTNAEPTDSRADEKVIVNEQLEDKVVNAPTESGLNGSEDEFQS